MDVSVAAPFICKTEFCLTKDGVQFSTGDTRLAVDLEPFFEQDPEALVTQWTRLRDVIVAQK